MLLYQGAEPELGSFVVGDIVRVKGCFGWFEVDDSDRITEWACAVDANGAEETKLSLAPLEAFTDA